MYVGWTLLEVAASLAVLLGQAARLIGAAQALRKTTSFLTDPLEEAFLGPRIAQARKAMGDIKFEAVEAVGRGISYADALVEVRELLSAIGQAASPASS